MANFSKSNLPPTSKKTSADTGKSSSASSVQLADNRPDHATQLRFSSLANSGKRDETVQRAGIEEDEIQMKGIDEEELQMKSSDASGSLVQNQLASPVQRAENKTGLPDQLKSGVENLSGYSLDDVKVHYNSAKPSQLQAHAYAQGTDIHVAPGQEKHLPHEAWHVVQQKQGRVKTTRQMKGKVNINDDKSLESEADIMGAKAMRVRGTQSQKIAKQTKEVLNRNALQFRGENPHENKAEHDGWELTAHHIVAHSYLKNSLTLLDKYDKVNNTTFRSDVLKSAIPKKITTKMLDKTKVNLTDFPGNETLESLQKRLTGEHDNNDLDGDQMKKIDSMRESFVEWQGGNQFLGPNTSIRAEPTSSGDDIDYDGRDFSPLSRTNFNLLVKKGEELKKPVSAYGDTDKIEKKVKGEDISKDHANLIKEKLLEILNITKDEIPEEFDISKWVEITDIKELRELAGSEKFGRKHLEDYAFYKIPNSNLQDVKLVYQGGTFSFDGKELGKKERPIVKGTNNFIGTQKAKKVVGQSKISLDALCIEKGVLTSTYLPKGVAEKGREIIQTEKSISSISNTLIYRGRKIDRLNHALEVQKDMKPEKRKKFREQLVETISEMSELQEKLKELKLKYGKL